MRSASSPTAPSAAPWSRRRSSRSSAPTDDRTTFPGHFQRIGLLRGPDYPEAHRGLVFEQGIQIMKITLGILAVCYGLALSACDTGGMASSPNTCLKDGSVSWWVNPNKEGQ